MLKWSGDFTLPRFRAKLAEKYSFHPDVEPEYGEFYRPDLGATIVSRKGPGPASTWSGPGGFYPGGTFQSSASTGALRKTGGSGPNDTFLTATGGSAQFRRSWQSSSAKELRMNRTLSVPALGSRRLDRAPASLQPLPCSDLLAVQGFSSTGAGPDAGRRYGYSGFAAGGASVLGSMPSTPAACASPTAGMVPSSPTSAEEKKELEKEKQAENASRRLWSCVSASECTVKKELEAVKAEADKDGELTEQQQISRLGKRPIESIRLIIKQGAKLEWRNEDWDGATLLLKAVRTDALELTMYLLGLGADQMAVDNQGRGILHWAAIQGIPGMVSLILNSCPDLPTSEVDFSGDSPLHLAAYQGHLVVVRLLVRKGADPAVENGGGFTPQQLAASRRMWPVVSYLANYRHQQLDNAPNAYGFDESSALVQQVARVLQARSQQHPEFTGLKDLLKLMKDHDKEKEGERAELAKELTRVFRLMKATDVEKDYVWKELAARMKSQVQEIKKA